jgi:tripartite-type tricarboxylate transporter receptor subunit TctC
VKRRALLQAAPALALAPWSAARAESYPDKTIRYIVPVAPGGGSDMVGRTICERWARALNATFVVDNQSGGGGVIACQTTMHAAPDGYTLMQGYVATHGTSPATRKLPYDAIKDFTPIGMIGATPNVLVVDANLPVKNFKEFVAWLNANKGHVSYGSAGPGSLTHLTMELLKQQLHVPMVHIPYRGIAPAITDVIGGQTQAMFPGLAAALPHIRAGKLRPLALTGKKRAPQIKDIPTLEELGLKNFDAMQWYGVVGPARMPSDVVNRLNVTLAQVLSAPDLNERLSGEAIVPQAMSSDAFGKYIAADVARWTALVKAQNLHIEG